MEERIIFVLNTAPLASFGGGHLFTVAIISKCQFDYRWSADVERMSVGQGELIVVIVNAGTGVAAVYHHRGRALPQIRVCVWGGGGGGGVRVCVCVRVCVPLSLVEQL